MISRGSVSGRVASSSAIKKPVAVFRAFAFRHIPRRTRHCLHPSLGAEHRRENVIVNLVNSIRAGKRNFPMNRMLRGNDLFDLPQVLLGMPFRIPEFDEGFRPTTSSKLRPYSSSSGRFA